MRAIILISIFATAYGSALLGAKECTWGPSYWCSHVNKAKQCEAVKHCMQTMWTEQKALKNQSIECEFCELVMKEARSILNIHGKDVKDVMNFINKTCDDIPEENYEIACHNVVNMAELFINMISNKDMTPVQICSTVLPCGEFSDKNPHKQITKTNKMPLKSLKETASVKLGGDICVDCKAFLQDIKDLLTNPATESQVEGMIKQLVCTNLGTLESVCDDAVDQYVPVAISALAAYVDPELACTALTFCGGSTQNTYSSAFYQMRALLSSVLTKFNFDYSGLLTCVECSVCKSTLANIRTMIWDRSFQAKVEDFIDNMICSKMGDHQAECKESVKNNALALFQLAEASLADPAAMCNTLRLCNTGEMTRTSVKSLLSAIKPVKGVGKSLECEACETTVSGLSMAVKSKYVQDEITGFLKNICSKLAGLQDECKKDVDMYAPLVFELLSSYLNDAGSLCKQLSLCQNGTKAHTLKAKSSLVGCDVCKEMVRSVDDYLKKNGTEAVLKEKLEELCGKLPEKFSGECKTFVILFLDSVLKEMEQVLDPETVCKDLGECPAVKDNTVGVVSVKEKKVDSDVICELCKDLVGMLKQYISQNKTEDEIKKELEKFCDKLASLKSQCDDFINTNFEMIYNMVTSELDPVQVCVKLNCCIQMKQVKKMDVSMMEVMPALTAPVPQEKAGIKNAESCLVCKIIMNYIHEGLDEKNIESLLDDVCSAIDKSFEKECEVLVSAYGDDIVKLLKSITDPNEICIKLGFCSSSSSQVKVSFGRMEAVPLRSSNSLVPGKVAINGNNFKKEIKDVKKVLLDKRLYFKNRKINMKNRKWKLF